MGNEFRIVLFPFLAFIQFSTIIAKISFAKAATMTTKILLIFFARETILDSKIIHTHTQTHIKKLAAKKEKEENAN